MRQERRRPGVAWEEGGQEEEEENSAIFPWECRWATMLGCLVKLVGVIGRHQWRLGGECVCV